MADRIILALACLLCAGAFFLMGYLCGISTNPVPFWSGGEQKLKESLKDVPRYNRKMATAFRFFGLSWLLNAILGAIFPMAGITGIVILCTLGLYLLYRSHRKTLSDCS